MKRVLWVLIVLLCAAPAFAQSMPPVLINGNNGGTIRPVAVDSSGNITAVYSDGTRTAIVDPCQANTKVYTVISQTANAQIVTGTASKKTYVCGVLLVAADAENVSFVAGTGSVCATSTVAVIGATTAANGPNLAANGGFAMGNGASAMAATTVNADNLCLFQSGSGRVAGVLVSVVQ